MNFFYSPGVPEYRAKRTPTTDGIDPELSTAMARPQPFAAPRPKGPPDDTSTVAAPAEAPGSSKPGTMTLQALKNLPLIGEGQAIGDRFDVSERIGKMLIDSGDAKETHPDVWIGTLHESIQVGTGTATGDAARWGVNTAYAVLTREKPLRVPYEHALAAVARGDIARKDAKWPFSTVRILSEEQAANWDASKLPPDPRYSFTRGFSTPEIPQVMVKALYSGVINGRYRVSEGEERLCDEPDAIMGSFLWGKQTTQRERLTFQCTLRGALSPRGQRFQAAVKDFISRSPRGAWSPTNPGFPVYSEFSDDAFERKAQDVRRIPNDSGASPAVKAVVDGSGTPTRENTHPGAC
jgi:hypothetical protein